MRKVKNNEFGITIDGERFAGDYYHKMISNRFPPRLVVQHTEKGWSKCDFCGKEYRIWMTHDKIWKESRKMAGRRPSMCVSCFLHMWYSSGRGLDRAWFP
jgi:hypothetical protein